MTILRKIARVLRDAAGAARRGTLVQFLRARYRSGIVARSDDRHVLYSVAHDDLQVPQQGLEVIRIASLDDVPPGCRLVADPQAMPDEWYRARLAEGARGYLCERDGAFGACLWIISGRELGEWYEEISPDDKVVYAVVAAERVKGQGIAPDLVRSALRAERAGAGRLLIDCKVWNTSARRAFEKVGFKSYATVAPGRMVPVRASR